MLSLYPFRQPSTFLSWLEFLQQIDSHQTPRFYAQVPRLSKISIFGAEVHHPQLLITGIDGFWW